MNDAAIKLHSLTPKFEEASHGLYLKLLEDQPSPSPTAKSQAVIMPF